jgi:hypothetical protein
MKIIIAARRRAPDLRPPNREPIRALLVCPHRVRVGAEPPQPPPVDDRPGDDDAGDDGEDHGNPPTDGEADEDVERDDRRPEERRGAKSPDRRRH